MPTRRTYGLILAGGSSRRMGRDKALLKRDGESQLSYMANVLSGSLAEVFVSAREDQSREGERSNHPMIVDRYDNLGPMAGILSALEEIPDVDWLIVACDLPNIDHLTLQNLLASRDHNFPFTAYISSHDGLPEPLCAVYGPEALPILHGYREQGIHCPRKVLINSSTQLLQQLDPASLDNVNTPDDLQASVLKAS